MATTRETITICAVPRDVKRCLGCDHVDNRKGSLRVSSDTEPLPTGNNAQTYFGTALTHDPTMFVERHGLIITPDMLPEREGKNINGPSVVAIPDWIEDRLGRYYLYFAHHGGHYIRLAYADAITGPWKIHGPGTLSLKHHRFLRDHVASPDVHVDATRREIIMYFHGRSVGRERQNTFVARSDDGVSFIPSPEALGPPYVRVFQHGRSPSHIWWYGIFGTGQPRLFRSKDGLSGFECGPAIMPTPDETLPHPRHLAVQKIGDHLQVYYTRRRDAPERILLGSIDLRKDWTDWAVAGETEVLRPATDDEGVGEPIRPSKNGRANGREHALRDPAIFEENGQTWLLYAVAGESGIALAEIRY